MKSQNNTNSKYERDKIIIEQDENKINRIINPYNKIRETIEEMVNNNE